MSRTKLKEFVKANLFYLFGLIISAIFSTISISLLLKEKEVINQLNVQILQLKQQLTAKNFQLKSTQKSFEDELQKIKKIENYISSGVITDRPEAFGKKIYSLAENLKVDVDSFKLSTKDKFIFVEFEVSGKEENVIEFISRFINNYPISIGRLTANKPDIRMHAKISFKIITGKLPDNFKRTAR